MIIRFNPQVPAAQPVAPAGGGGASLSKLGKTIAEVGGQLGQLAIQERDEQRVAERAVAHASALQNVNQFSLLFQDRAAELQTTLSAEGREEEFLTQVSELYTDMSDIFREQYTDLEFKDAPFYDVLVQNKLFPIKEGLHKLARKMVVDKNLRVFGESIADFQDEGQDISIGELDHRFGLLDAIGSNMEDNRVMEFGDKDKILQGALVAVMKSRASRNTEEFGEAAKEINAAEAKFMRSRLLPLYNVELAQFARGEREAGHKLTIEGEQVALRQLTDRVSMGEFDSEVQVLAEAQESGLSLRIASQVYTEYRLKEQSKLQFQRNEAERLFKKNSEVLTTDAIVQASRKDAKFDAISYIQQNFRELTDPDKEKLLKYQRVFDKARNAETDPRTFQEYIQRADEDPFGKEDTFDEDVLAAHAAGLFSDEDYEKVVTRRANNKRVVAGRAKTDALYREGLVVIDRAMRRTIHFNSDRIAQEHRAKARARLNGANYAPEQNKQDFTDFHEAPLKFINKVAAEASFNLDLALAQAAEKSLDTILPELAANLVTHEGKIRTDVVLQALKEKRLKPLEAERFILMHNMILRGSYKLPDGRVPKPPLPAPPKPVEEKKGLFERLGEQIKDMFTFESESEPTPEPRRKARKVNPFAQ